MISQDTLATTTTKGHSAANMECYGSVALSTAAAMVNTHTERVT